MASNARPCFWGLGSLVGEAWDPPCVVWLCAPQRNFISSPFPWTMFP